MLRYTAKKFFRTMALRSRRMDNMIVQFTAKYNHRHLDCLVVRSEHSTNAKLDELDLDIYDDILVENPRPGQKHLVFRIVNSNLKYFYERVVNYIRANEVGLDDDEKRKAMLAMYDYYGLRDELDRSKIYELESFEKILDLAFNRTKTPMTWFSGATSRSISGMVGIDEYESRLREDHEFLIYEDEYRFGIEAIQFLKEVSKDDAAGREV